MEDMLRTLLIALEARVGEKIDPSWPIYDWVVEHAAAVINKYRPGRDGKTNHERLYGKECNKPICGIGERVFFKPLEQRNKMAARFENGVWLQQSFEGRNIASKKFIYFI